MSSAMGWISWGVHGIGNVAGRVSGGIWNVKETVAGPLGHLGFLVPQGVFDRYVSCTNRYNTLVVEPTKNRWDRLSTYVDEKKAALEEKETENRRKKEAVTQNSPAYEAVKNEELNFATVFERGFCQTNTKVLQGRVEEITKKRLTGLGETRKTGIFITAAGVSLLLGSVIFLNWPVIVAAALVTFVGREIIAITRGVSEELTASIQSTSKINATLSPFHSHPLMQETRDAEKELYDLGTTAFETQSDNPADHMTAFVNDTEVPKCREVVEKWEQVAEMAVKNITVAGSGFKKASLFYQMCEYFTRPVVHLG